MSEADQIVECVPNFSEGRREGVLHRLVETIEHVNGAVVLDTHADVDHNRSVITFAGAPDIVSEAAFRVVERAATLIDMRAHSGEHPRIGATDVLPFVPVAGVTMDDCVALAHATGRRIAHELGIPVYFYERAALRPDRAPLENVRRHGIEELRTVIATDPDRAPDVGPLEVHETAGAIAVGARPFLIAFNVNLRTRDLSIGRKIAKSIRARDGGLLFLKALGFDLTSRGLVQVSMNLVDHESTGIKQAFAAVAAKAREFWVDIAGTEIVGLVPRAAIDESDEYYGLLENFAADAIVESRIQNRFKPFHN